MHLQESAEMYIETIYLLSRQNGFVRSIDVAEHMGYSKPSVSRAVAMLKQNGYLDVQQDHYLHLTEKGVEVAQKIFERHTVLSGLLMSLGVDEEVSVQDACRIEHVISEESFNAIKRYLDNMKR